RTPQSSQGRFATELHQVGADEAVGPASNFGEFSGGIRIDWHFASMHTQNLFAAFGRWRWEKHFAVKSSSAPQCRIDRLHSIRGANHHHAFGPFASLHQ